MEKCEHCGKEFEKVQYSQRFCSSSCRIAWHNAENCKAIKEARNERNKR